MNEIERQVMDWLPRGDHPVLETLRTQLSAATVRGRDLTGVGFFSEFAVPAKSGALDALECFIHEDAWPADAKLLRLYYVRPQPPEGIESRETAERDLAWALEGAT